MIIKRKSGFRKKSKKKTSSLKKLVTGGANNNVEDDFVSAVVTALVSRGGADFGNAGYFEALEDPMHGVWNVSLIIGNSTAPPIYVGTIREEISDTATASYGQAIRIAVPDNLLRQFILINRNNIDYQDGRSNTGWY